MKKRLYFEGLGKQGFQDGLPLEFWTKDELKILLKYYLLLRLVTGKVYISEDILARIQQNKRVLTICYNTE
jgi:hypothetical protein